jgi:UDP-2,3-diacylglucosamine pyrophosphatase LpxH
MQEKKSIVIVSDLHMGDGGPRDNFAADNKEIQFSLFLDYVEAQESELFILGDLFEFWQAAVGRVLLHRMPFLDRFAQMKAVYIVGNHDADIADLIGTGLLNHPFFASMCGPFSRQIGSRIFHFMHGHEVDPFNRDGTPRWGRILAILAGIIEDRKGSPLLSAGGLTEKSLLKVSRFFMWLWNDSVNWFEKGRRNEPAHQAAESLTPAQEPERVKGFLSLYQKDRLEKGYDCLVAGHMHIAGLVGNWYANSGCWVGLRNNFLQITPAGIVQVWEWRNGRAVLIEESKSPPGT